MARTEKRLLLDLQVIKGATPAPAAATPHGGFAPQKKLMRGRIVDIDSALLLRALGVITDLELAAIVADS